MARTPSNMIPLGTPATDFILWEPLTNSKKSLQELKGEKGTLIMFICNHCPFVKHINHKLVEIANTYIPKGIAFIAINSNDIENYPEDAPEKMIEVSKELGYPFPYLFDETQEVAKAYDAACTPDFYLFDQNLLLVYRGQMDSSRPGNDIPTTGEDLINAMECLLNNQPIPSDQKPSLGCNIKWKKTEANS